MKYYLSFHSVIDEGSTFKALAVEQSGSPETKLSIAAFLGELVLKNDVKVLVARTVGSSLIDIMKHGNMSSREAALKSLNQISSYESSAKILIEAEDIVHNFLHLISNTGPAIECKLLQVLVGLTSYPTTVFNAVSSIKSSAATISLIQFIEAPQKDLRVASIKLLRNLSPHMDQELARCLRGTSGQLGSLIKVISENTGITEEQAVAVGLLADLPERDRGLTRQMLDEGVFPLNVAALFIELLQTNGLDLIMCRLDQIA
ncbi:U-box domain-containing protein 44-like [Nicotiana tabacum]|uniref:U-box domain-containing protein 44-like n=1 Tax=Nicotiana tabacum TaxID=4097 RepID=A0AC58SF99_TOBAC